MILHEVRQGWVANCALFAPIAALVSGAVPR